MAVATAGSAADPKKEPKPEQFFGKWVGKWDGKWKVQFTVYRDPQTKETLVLYEREERVGEPLKQELADAVFEEGVLWVGENIEISLSSKDPDKATAKGHFFKARTAELSREKPPAEKPGKKPSRT